MTIIRKDYMYHLCCDICHEAIGEFDTFDEAIDGKEELEVVSRRINGEWCDICNQCLR